MTSESQVRYGSLTPRQGSSRAWVLYQLISLRRKATASSFSFGEGVGCVDPSSSLSDVGVENIAASLSSLSRSTTLIPTMACEKQIHRVRRFRHIDSSDSIPRLKEGPPEETHTRNFLKFSALA